MPVIVNKIGAYKNEDAMEHLIFYMTSSNFRWSCNGCGVMEEEARSVINAFTFTKQMYGKQDHKQVAHFIIGAKEYGITPSDLFLMAEAALDYFWKIGYQCFYVIHKGSEESAEYLHVHLAVNTINYRNGYRLSDNYGVISELRNTMQEQFGTYNWSSFNDTRVDWEE